MPKDQLFLLRPSFADPAAGGGPFHCPECARVEGLLSFFPALRERLDVHYVDFPRPRAPIAKLLGEAHQGCPVLVPAGRAAGPGVQTSDTTGRAFVAGPDAISAYLARTHGISSPHP